MTGAAIVGRITRAPVAVRSFNGAPFVPFQLKATDRMGKHTHYACFTVSQAAHDVLLGLSAGAVVAVTPRHEIMTGRGMARGVRCIVSWSARQPPCITPHARRPK
jgi:hypothetical protein